MATDEIIIRLFCIVADRLHDVKPHPDAKLHPSEVVTIGLLYALKGNGGSLGTGVTATRCSGCSADSSMGQSGAWGRLDRRDGDAEAANAVDPARPA